MESYIHPTLDSSSSVNIWVLQIQFGRIQIQQSLRSGSREMFLDAAGSAAFCCATASADSRFPAAGADASFLQAGDTHQSRCSSTSGIGRSSGRAMAN